MPELPEVEVVRRGLVTHARGRRLTGIEVCDERIFRRARHVCAPLESAIGARITEVARRGKYLWLPLPDSRALVMHLGMSGQILANPSDAVRPRHTRVQFLLDDGGRIDFVDQRTFGACWVSECEPTVDGQPAGEGTSSAMIPIPLAHIGRDVCDPALNRDTAARRMRQARRPIKAVLLDQTIVSGIGNIYADEALHAATIHPLRWASGLSCARLRDLLLVASEVMARALAQGGTSFDDLYVDIAGHPGYFQRELAIYGRTSQPCLSCGYPIERLIVAGRGTHVCPRCQPPPARSRARGRGA